ncbi:MAG TPA: phytanoyl-CoA dioxygenase family protein, partial [Vicinamibacterales bacterium]|nr:phytanoyl-CoA dioxygenase family protein [Vicinamibacterales bacterium]
TRGSELHVDVPRDSMDWPLVSFILMVDDFRPENGATRFVPGSHLWPHTPADVMSDTTAAHDEEEPACGAAGSMIIFNGSTWHGYTANRTDRPRRSLQGAFIPRAGRPATDWEARLTHATRSRLDRVALDLLRP